MYTIPSDHDGVKDICDRAPLYILSMRSDIITSGQEKEKKSSST